MNTHKKNYCCNNQSQPEFGFMPECQMTAPAENTTKSIPVGKVIIQISGNTAKSDLPISQQPANLTTVSTGNENLHTIKENSNNNFCLSNGKQKFFPLHPDLEKETMELVDGRISDKTGENLASEYKKEIIRGFKLFNHFVLTDDPECPCNKLKCFTPTHAISFKKKIMTQKDTISPLTGKKVSKGYLSAIINSVKTVFVYAKEDNYIDDNPFKDIIISTYNKNKNKSENDLEYLSSGVIDKITYVDKDKMSKMNITEKYFYLLPRVMFRICYEIAARSCEIVRLCVEDISLTKLKLSGLIPSSIIGGKARPSGFKDTVWILYNNIKPWLDIWLEVRSEYYKFCNKEDIPIDGIPKRNGKGRPLFPNLKDLSVMSEKTTYKTIYKNFLKENNLPESIWGRTHIPRISRITNWIMERWDFRNVNKNARHKTFKETERYFKGNDDDTAILIEQDLNLTKVPTLNGIALPEESTMNFMLYTAIEMLKKNKIDIFNPATNKISLVKEIMRDIYQNILKTSNINHSYTIKDLQQKWKLEKTQTYQRLKLLEQTGHIHPTKNMSGELAAPIWEVDSFDKEFVGLIEAVKIAKCHYQILRDICANSKIAGRKIGKLWFLNRAAFMDWLYERNLKKEKNGQTG